MKRTRPRQHLRRLKSGKKIVINRGIKPKKKRSMPKVYHGTTSWGAHNIKKKGIKTSEELQKTGDPNMLSELTVPTRTYFFRDPDSAATWAEVATKSSPFPNAKSYVVVADIPEEELNVDTEMKFGQAVYKEGSVPPEKILDVYEIEPRFAITPDGVKRVPDDKRKRKRALVDADEIIAYHGTDSETAKKILDKGILPATKTDNQNMPRSMRGWNPRMKEVSLTTMPTYAAFYAEAAANRLGGEPVILSAKIPKEKGKLGLSPYPGQDEYYVESVPPNNIKVLAKGKKEISLLEAKRFGRDWNKNLPPKHPNRHGTPQYLIDYDIAEGMKMLTGDDNA